MSGPPLARNLQLLDAFHEVQNATEPPEALLAEHLRKLLQAQAVPATETQITQAVALYQVRQASAAMGLQLSSASPAALVASVPDTRTLSPTGWRLAGLLGVALGSFFGADAIHGALQGYPAGGVVLDLLFGSLSLATGLTLLVDGTGARRAQAGRFLARFYPIGARGTTGTEVAPEAAGSSLSRTWAQGAWTDPMDGRVFSWARQTSTEPVRYYPHSRRGRLQFQVAQEPTSGLVAAALWLEEGQFASEERIRLQLGNEGPSWWPVDPYGSAVPAVLRGRFPNEGSLLFFQDPELLLAAMVGYPSLIVDVPLYDRGTILRTFPWTSFPLPVSDTANARLASDRPATGTQWTVRPTTVDGWVQQELACLTPVWTKDHKLPVQLVWVVRHHPEHAIRMGFVLDSSAFRDSVVVLQVGQEGTAVTCTAEPGASEAGDFSEEGPSHRERWLADGLNHLMAPWRTGAPFRVLAQMKDRGWVTFTFRSPTVPAADEPA